MLSLSKINERQEEPRLSRTLLREYLEALVESGHVVRRVMGGRGRNNSWAYRKAQTGETLAKANVRNYNSEQRNKNSLDADVDYMLQYLHPLRLGRPVLIWMNLPVKTVRKTRGNKDRKLVVIQTGHAAGLDPELILISIIGGGCVVVHPLMGSGVADLVLAGMPVKMAKELMNKIHRIFKGN